MPQDHPAPVSGERGTHRRLTDCRGLPRYAPTCIHPADPECPQRVTLPRRPTLAAGAFPRRYPYDPGHPPNARFPLSVAPVLPLRAVVRCPGAPSVPVIRRPRRGRLFLRCRRPGSEFVDETNVLVPPWAPSGATLCPHFAKNPPPVSFPEKCPFSAIRLFSHPCKTRGFGGGFWRFGFQTPLFRPVTAADCNFVTLMPHFAPPARQGGLTAFRRGVLPFLMEKCYQNDVFLRHFSRFQTIFTKSLQKSSRL